LAAIRGLEFSVGVGQIFRVDHGLCPPTQQFGTVRAELSGQSIELRDEVIVELNQDFTSSHDHMVSHMRLTPSANLATSLHRARVPLLLRVALGACSTESDASLESTVTSAATSTVTTESAPGDSVVIEAEPDDLIAIESAPDAFGMVMGWLAGEELSEPDYEVLFAVGFRDQVSYDQFVSGLEQVGESGPWRSVEKQVETDTEVTKIIETPSEDGERLSVGLTVSDGQIDTLWFRPGGSFDPPDTIEEAVLRLEAMGTLRYAVFDQSGGTCAVVSDQGADEPMALGSVFKLYVLFAIQLAVDAGELDWTDPITIRDELDSFPGGTTQDVEPGTTLTIRELAELMISISDNTATDHLIDVVGRDAVEAAVVAAGHATPELLVPFLKTRELFVLKTVFTQAERRAYIAADSEARRDLLDTTVAKTPLGSLADLVWPGPIDIDTLEWFGSPIDVCRVLSALASSAESREILAINPGVPAPAVRWEYIGFKGGSEPGVLAMSWFVESPLGDSYVVAGSVTNTETVLNETEVINLLAAIRDLVGTN